MINYIEIYEEIDNFLETLYKTEQYKDYIDAHNIFNKNEYAKNLQFEIEDLIEKIVQEKELNNYSKKYNELFREYNKKLKIFYDIPEVVNVLNKERCFQNFLEYISKDIAQLFTENISFETFRNITLENDKCSNCSLIQDLKGE